MEAMYTPIAPIACNHEEVHDESNNTNGLSRITSFVDLEVARRHICISYY